MHDLIFVALQEEMSSLKVALTGKRLSARSIAILGLLMALQLVLGKFPVFGIWSVRVDFVFLATFIMGWWFGPWWAGLAAVICDLVNTLILGGSGTYFVGFTISAFLGGVIYGVFFYRQNMSWWRVIMATLIIMLVVNVFLNTLWLTILYKTPFWGILPIRILKDLILTPIQVLLVYWLGTNRNMLSLRDRL